MRRHNRIRDWVAAELAAATGVTAPIEQLVPELSTPELAARLDVIGADPVSGRPLAVDVAVTHAPSKDPARSRPRASRDGAAAAAEEEVKRRRYPCERVGFVSPFVLETGGRAGAEAETLVRSLALRPGDPDRASRIAGLWRRCSTTLQLGNADMVLAANGGTEHS